MSGKITPKRKTSQTAHKHNPPLLLRVLRHCHSVTIIMSFTDDAMPYYWIECCDGNMVPVEKGRLRELLKLMPILEYLLFGHPQMAPKVLKIRDGMTVLQIPPDLGINGATFVLVMNCALEITPLPVTDKANLLCEAVAVLGGCESLEKRMRHIDFYSPLSPEEDTQNKFDWQLFVKSVYRDINMYDTKDYIELGYSFVSRTMVENNQVMYLFRRPKQA